MNLSTRKKTTVIKGLLGAMPAVALLSLPALGQTAATVQIPSGVFYKGLEPRQYAARDRLLGANVVNKDGVVIGDIKDLILSPSNEVEGVLLGTGGILGAGEKEVGVRYGALQFSRKDDKLVISLPQATKEVIAALEPFAHGPKKSLAEKAADKARAILDKTTVGAGPALEKAKEATSAAFDKAKAAAGPVLEKAKEATSAAVEKGKELGKAAMEKGKDAADAVKDKAAGTMTPSPAPSTDVPKQ